MPKQENASALSADISPIPIEPKYLLLDPLNPRLAQYNMGAKASQPELLTEIWRRMACSELALSMVHDHYWSHEPLFAVRQGPKDYVVIEGNRRLAAIKALLDSTVLAKVAGNDFPQPSPAVLRSLERIPVIVVEDRMSVWKYIGFKHVNGPAKWGSYAKAQYIASVRSSGVPLADIAEQIGDTNRTVQRLYRAYMVISQAEDAKVWKRDFAYKKQLSFSHLMTGLDYDGIAEFISVAEKTDEDPKPVPADKLDNLKQLCEWLWGDSRSNTPPVIQSQNPDLRNLDRVLRSAPATDRLKKDHRLDVALEESLGDSVIFHAALSDARQALSRAQSKVSTGFQGEAGLIETAREIATSSVDLLETMRSKVTKPDDLKKRIGE